MSPPGHVPIDASLTQFALDRPQFALDRRSANAHNDGVVAIRSATEARRRALYVEALEIIEREYSSALELDEVAHRIATSRRQLQRAFTEVGGAGFRSHLARVRMRRARELLSGGGVAVRDVATSVGYRQPAQFARTFHRHHGAPPSNFLRP
jgi:AraC family transcriptional regulator, regulatory protein of adaptative response / methylphosphotriester-DNA alkyltransferase methyltransferase